MGSENRKTVQKYTNKSQIALDFFFPKFRNRAHMEAHYNSEICSFF